jgi:hypothetical protein
LLLTTHNYTVQQQHGTIQHHSTSLITHHFKKTTEKSCTKTHEQQHSTST